MEKWDGYTVISETETELVQEHIREDGIKVTVVGNPHPDPVEQQKHYDEIGALLQKIHRRIEADRLAAESQNESSAAV